MDLTTRRAIEAAGFLIEGDSAITQLAPGINVTGSGLQHFLAGCATQKIDPVRVLSAVVENARKQPVVRAAMATPGHPTVNVQIRLKDVHLKKAS
jgi:hypothetical protein